MDIEIWHLLVAGGIFAAYNLVARKLELDRRVAEDRYAIRKRIVEHDHPERAAQAAAEFEAFESLMAASQKKQAVAHTNADEEDVRDVQVIDGKKYTQVITFEDLQ